MKIAILIASLLVGYGIGYVGAHADVRDECERLGKFYVGANVFNCEKDREK